MTLRLLDTDVVTLWLRGDPAVTAAVLAQPPESLVIAIVTVEEILGGWYARIRKAKGDAQLVLAYAALQQAVEIAARLRILPFDAAAAAKFRSYRTANRRAGANDLRIAAIAATAGATLVTRNRRDFEALRDLAVESW